MSDTAVILPPGEETRSESRKGFRHKDAVSLLRRLIEIGELAPGERLREVAISERLGMSRTPVREAFRTLAAEGLVELLPNRSVVVAEIDRSEIADVFLALGTLEALAATQACERITDAEIARLGALQAELERYYGAYDRENYVNTNRAIHDVIVRASRNASLIVAWRTILPRADRARNANNINRSRWTEALHEHRLIYTAIAQRDGARIARLMEDHFRNGLADAHARGGYAVTS
jgi:DNA-binding GntR family transcriptional regulator